MGCFQPLESTQSLWVPSPTPHCIDTVSPHDNTERQGRGMFSALTVFLSLHSYIQQSCLFAGVRRNLPIWLELPVRFDRLSSQKMRVVLEITCILLIARLVLL